MLIVLCVYLRGDCSSASGVVALLTGGKVSNFKGWIVCCSLDEMHLFDADDRIEIVASFDGGQVIGVKYGTWDWLKWSI